MTRHLVLLGGNADDASQYSQSIQDRRVLVECLEDPNSQITHPCDILLTLDRRAIEMVAHGYIAPKLFRTWIAVIEPGDSEAASSARKAGVGGLIVKGSTARYVREQVARALERIQLLEQQQRLKKRISQGGWHTPCWIARNEATRAAGAMIGRVAPLRIPLLIHGETGSGRSHLAALIHESGPRSDRPLITLDCKNLEPARIGARLFGKEPGAFANDELETDGAIFAAEGGTLVLDDLAAIPEPVQTMLLEFLQTGTYQRVGALEPRRGDVRIIAIADKTLEERLHEKSFRLDLFQSLQALRINLPPLRDRPEEIAPLLFHFLSRDADLCFPPITDISADALAQFKAHHWPGNARELQDALRAACALTRGPVLELWETGPHARTTAAKPGVVTGTVDIALPLLDQKNEAAEEVERNYLDKVLRRYGGRIAPAAKHSGITRQLMSNKIKLYQIPLSQYRDSTAS